MTDQASRKVVLAFLRDFTRHSKDISGRPKIPDLSGSGGSTQQQLKTPVAGLHNVRVLLVSDDATSRQFPFWASRSIEQKDDLSKEVDDALFSEENIDQTVRPSGLE